MTGKDILQEEFERAGIRGYKAESVDAFLAKVAAYVDKQEEEKNELLYKVKILAEKIEEYKGDEENIREALLGAQKLGTSILNEAKAKSEAMLQEARTTYDTTISQAKTKAEATTKETIQKANMDLNEIRRESEKERILLEKMKKEIATFRASIYKQYKNHLDLLASLPVPASAAEARPSDEAPAETAKTSSFGAEDIKPQFASASPRVQFFDQDAEPAAKQDSDLSDSRLKADGGLFFTKTQTVASDITSTASELEKEEAGQTKEFASDIPDAEEETDIKEDTQPTSNSQEFRVNIGTPSGGQRPNYMEKFGELKFGGFGQSDKDKQTK